jgi:hypothetical protein
VRHGTDARLAPAEFLRVAASEILVRLPRLDETTFEPLHLIPGRRLVPLVNGNNGWRPAIPDFSGV